MDASPQPPPGGARRRRLRAKVASHAPRPDKIALGLKLKNDPDYPNLEVRIGLARILIHHPTITSLDP